MFNTLRTSSGSHLYLFKAVGFNSTRTRKSSPLYEDLAHSLDLRKLLSDHGRGRVVHLAARRTLDVSAI